MKARFSENAGWKTRARAEANETLGLRVCDRKRGKEEGVRFMIVRVRCMRVTQRVCPCVYVFLQILVPVQNQRLHRALGNFEYETCKDVHLLRKQKLQGATEKTGADHISMYPFDLPRHFTTPTTRRAAPSSAPMVAPAIAPPESALDELDALISHVFRDLKGVNTKSP